jgi:hypothetical protein
MGIQKSRSHDIKLFKPQSFPAQAAGQVARNFLVGPPLRHVASSPSHWLVAETAAPALQPH